jgi:hypothetical protein
MSLALTIYHWNIGKLCLGPLSVKTIPAVPPSFGLFFVVARFARVFVCKYDLCCLC